MKKIHSNFPPAKTWRSLMAIALATSISAYAQEGSQGNTTIFGGAEMTFFGNHDFVAGGGGAQPGVILTQRRTGNFGILNFSGNNLVSQGASDAGYVDGYVRKYGTGPFIFPVGDNGFLGQFAASADGTMGAYFHTDANSAVTSNLFQEPAYPALPAGGPFATTSRGPNLVGVSTIEYWDIDGANATPLTLTWDAGSDIAGLTTSEIDKLTIVGWDGTAWVIIPSKVDVTSILGGASSLTAGSITTINPLAPDTYVAYTFGTLTRPLPVTLANFTAKAENNAALLSWTTTEETNSDRFEIERSRNGKNWNQIGQVKSQGESKGTVHYSFSDGNPEAGENLYRLKMVDADGTFAYSSLRDLTFEGRIGFKPFPNPATDRFRINNPEQIRQVVLYNASGVKVYGSQKVTAEGIDVTRLAPGIYTATLTLLDGTINTHKLAVGR